MTEPQISTSAWEELERIIASGGGEAVQAFVQLLPPGEVPYTLSRLSEEQRTRLFAMVTPEFAADLLEHFADEHAADLIEELPAPAAAAIFDEMDSNDQADVLAELDDEEAHAILERLDPQDAAEIRQLAQYDPDTAGGLLQTEFLAFPETSRVGDVIHDLRTHADEYEDYDARYLYVANHLGELQGMVPMRKLVLSQPDVQLTDLMLANPVHVSVDTSLSDLEDLFEHYDFSAAPVLDNDGKLVGVVQLAAVEEALGEAAEDALLKVSGIVTGEEMRSMPLMTRSLKRMVFLAPSLFLLLISASVIAFFEHSVLKQVTAVMIFLPVVAGLCGCSGNQAMAVSQRELSLGLVKPTDAWRIFYKEMMLGLINGLALGAMLFVVCWVWKGDPYLGVVVGGAIPFAMMLAVVLGGVVPLILRSFNIDPAMGSGPVITTLVDFASFAMVLGLAYFLLIE